MMILTQNLIDPGEVYNFVKTGEKPLALTFFTHVRTTILEEIDQVQERLITPHNNNGVTKKFIEYEFTTNILNGKIVLQYIGLTTEINIDKSRLSHFETVRFLSKYITKRLGIQPDFIDDKLDISNYTGMYSLSDADDSIPMENARFNISDLIPSYGINDDLIIELQDFNLDEKINSNQSNNILIHSYFKNTWIKKGGDMTAVTALDITNKKYGGIIKYNLFSFSHLREIHAIKLAR